MPTILGENFWGDYFLNPWRNKAETFAGRILLKNLRAILLKFVRPKSETRPTFVPLQNQQVAYHTKQTMLWICLNSALAVAEDVMESKMSRHLEIQTFGRIKAPLAETPFS